MQKIFLLVFCLLGSVNLFSQTVNDVPIRQIDVEYVQLIGRGRENKVKVDLDFGQKSRAWTKKDKIIKDEEGKTIKFNSMIDALNFMSLNGFEFVTAYAYSEGNGNVYHYLLRKRKK